MNDTVGDENILPGPLEPCDQNHLAWLQQQLAAIQKRLDRFLPQHDDGLTTHFHLGMVGGSGRKVRHLNRQRERALERIITRSAAAAPLIFAKQRIEQEIAFVSSGQAARQRKLQQLEEEMKAVQRQQEKELYRALPRIPLPPDAREMVRQIHRDYKGERYCSTCGGITTWLLYRDRETQATCYGCWHLARHHLSKRRT